MSLSTVLAVIFGGILAGYAFVMCSMRLVAILQQEGYAGGAFLRWYYRSRNIERKKASLLALALALLTALFSVCFSFLGYEAANLISVVPFAGICILYCVAEHKRALRVPLKPTMRAMRLAIAYLIVMFALCVGLGFALVAVSMAADTDWVYLLRFVPFALVPLLCPPVLAFVNVCMKAYEAPHANKFVKRAQAALAESGAVKVGITGSFGKTSVKNFAAVILSEKYKVIATPASYNTPAGIARTVNEGGLDCEIFLAEMGARRTGDISELCDIVRPTVGVVTGVCAQHAETFGSLDAIRAEKGVLARRTEQCVLGRSASDMDGGNALVMGRLLGMTVEEIAAGIAEIAPVPHRLERREGNGVVILDDAYNCNAEGAKNAVEVLRLAAGRKFVVTPGIVELGQLEEEVNGALGAALVGLDRVILVGETLVLDVRSGYLAAGGDESRLTIVPTLQKAQELLAKELAAGDCVLFLNDLPDIY